MSDPVNEIMNSEDPPTIESTTTIVIEEEPAPVEEEPAVEEPVVEEPAPVVEEPAVVVEEPAVEEPVVEEPAPVVEEPAPVVEEPVVEEPAVVEEPVVEEPTPVVEEPAPVVEEPTPVVEEPAPVVEEPVVPEEPAVVEEPAVPEEPVVSYDHVCSLQTLTQVLGKWSGGEIRRRNVESLLKEGTETDENLDTIEKVVEILTQWIQKGGSEFRKNNHFLNIDEYTLEGESHNLSVQKKNEILKTLTELIINVSQGKLNDQGINTILNNLY